MLNFLIMGIITTASRERDRLITTKPTGRWNVRVIIQSVNVCSSNIGQTTMTEKHGYICWRSQGFTRIRNPC